jgi:chemotaxis protein methyltransferase CheR
MVTFFPLNLADAIFPAPLNAAATVDVIFCRNVFIYFSSERAQTVIRNFHHTLADGGWLIVSPSETPYLTHSPFTAVSLPGIIIHRKDEPPYRSTFGGNPSLDLRRKAAPFARTLNVFLPRSLQVS